MFDICAYIQVRNHLLAMYVVNSFEFRLFSVAMFARCMIASRIMHAISVDDDLQIVMHGMITGEHILENVRVFVIFAARHSKQKPLYLFTASFIQTFFHIHAVSVISGCIDASS
jgi:hypothetical protein